MRMNELFPELVERLNDEGYSSRIIKADKDTPADQLIVALSLEHLDWDLHLEMACVGDLSQPKPDPDEIDFLQFFVPLPLQIQAEQLLDLIRFITLSNNALPMVGFGCTEAQGLVFFRHLMVIVNGKVDSEAVVETIRTIEYIIETFGKALDDLALGKRSYNQILTDDIRWA
jgi:hypothetical protein